MVNTEIRLIIFFAAKDGEALYSQQKTRPGADCGLDHELLDVQAGFRKGRGTRDQIANIHWIMEETREFQKKHLFLLY